MNCLATIAVRAVEVSPSDTSCTAVRSSTTALTGTVSHSFTPSSASQPAAQIQSGASYVNFTGPTIFGGYYAPATDTPPDYVLARSCWRSSNGASGEASAAYVSSNVAPYSTGLDNETLTFDIGYRVGSPWVQTGGGGDIYALNALTSYIPSTITPRLFHLDSLIGYPGVVAYGTSYDFDRSITSTGANLVSSKNWLVNETYASTDYYQTFYRRFGSPTTYTHTNPSFAAPPSECNGTTCYVANSLTVSGNWNVGSGSYVFIVDGDLAINGRINLSGSGFVAFIVKNNITVSSSVGGLYSSSAPQVEGIYITGPGGTFSTGTSVIGTERFVGKGIFVAGNFSLNRDLAVVNQNTTTASELFIYNPRLLVIMPDPMRDLPITWEEVAP